MAGASRELARQSAGDQRLRDFLDGPEKGGFGRELDLRAGNECRPEPGTFCHATDEDHVEGMLSKAFACVYTERSCYFACTLDHFFPMLSLPTGRGTAIEHAEHYMRMAVALYRASICAGEHNSEIQRLYRRWSARALGHAIHLVEDMGSPPHTRPENHGPFPVGNGPSFLEYWALDAWDRTQYYTKPRSGERKEVGKFQNSAAEAQAPRTGHLMDIMGSLAAESSRFFDSAPYSPGQTLLYRHLEQLLAESDFKPSWGDKTCDRDGSCRERLVMFHSREYPNYYLHWDHDSGIWDNGHGFVTPASVEPDYSSDAVWQHDDAQVRILSNNLAARLWVQPDVEAENNPVTFDLKLKGLITHTTEAAAGAMLAFWDQVKDYQCSCAFRTPCQILVEMEAEEAGEAPPFPEEPCLPVPAIPTPPGRDYPDDNAAVVATAPGSVAAATGDVLEATQDAAFVVRNWERIAATGIEKGITSLGDLGYTYWLLSAAQPLQGVIRLDEESQNTVSAALAALSSKYATARQRPEQDLDKAAHVALFNAGFADGAGKLLERLGYTWVTIGATFDPLAAARERTVMMIPSGGLYGAGDSEGLRERLQAYVEAGGTLVVMAQMHGADLRAIPPKDGWHGYGWFEDQSCWRDSVRPAIAHPITASADREVLSIPVDGFLDRWPDGSEVLLRRVSGNSAAMVLARLGAGHVVVTSSFEDWAEASGSTSPAGLRMMGDLLTWARKPSAARLACVRGQLCSGFSRVTVMNYSDDSADRVEWSIVDSLGRPLDSAATWQESWFVGAGQRVTFDVPIELSGSRTERVAAGTYTLRYRLLDSRRGLRWVNQEEKPWQVQVQSEAGQLMVTSWPPGTASKAGVSAGLTVDGEIVPEHALVPVHLTLRNDGDTPFVGSVSLSHMAPGVSGWLANGSVDIVIPPRERLERDVSIGPLTTQPGHDGLPGGAYIRAEVNAAGVDAPIEVVSRSVLTNVTYLGVEFRAEEIEAGPGDTVHLRASLANQSRGRLQGRYQVVYTNVGNLISRDAAVQRGAWTQFDLAADATTTIVEPFMVPQQWQGTLAAQLFFCFPRMSCWETGVAQYGNWFTYHASVDLPLSFVQLAVGDLEVTASGSLRVPVTVRNVGRQPVVSGRVKLELRPGGGEATGPAFDLDRGAEILQWLEIPVALQPGGELRDWRLQSHFTDRLWTARDPSHPWTFFESRPVRYGADLIIASPLVARAGAEQYTGDLVVRNRSTFPRLLHLSLTAPGADYSLQRDLALNAAQQQTIPIAVPVPANMPYGSVALIASIADDAFMRAATTTVLEHRDGGPVLAVSVVGEARAGNTLEGVVTLYPRDLVADVPGVLEVTSGELDLNVSRPVSLRPTAPVEERIDVTLPLDVTAGTKHLQVTWRQPNGHTVVTDATFRVSPARFDLQLAVQRVRAGESLVYSVANAGGVAASFDAHWRLLTPRETVATGEAGVVVAGGQKTEVSFHVPAGLRSGRYASVVEFSDPATGSTESSALEVLVSGVEATIEVATSMSGYTLGTPMEGWADITNGQEPIDGGVVRLEVLANREGCEGIGSWGAFQGGAERSGKAERGGPTVGVDRFEFNPAATADIPRLLAAAAGDLDGDGSDDIAAVGSTDQGAYSVRVFGGPDLRTRASLALNSAPVSASVAVGDADGDGELEIYEADITGGALTLRRFGATLVPSWVADLGAAPPVSPFPGGGPVLAELTGDRLEEIVISTGADVLAIEPLAGATIWRMGARAPELPPSRVTGTAAADVDGDGSIEVLVGLAPTATPGSGLIACLAADGALRWTELLMATPAGSPVVVRDDTEAPRVAAVEMPVSSAAGGALVLMRGDNGALLWRTVTSFWSEWQPAAGDIDGDGAAEYVVAVGDTNCETCAFNGVMAFENDGSLKWTHRDQAAGTSPPVLIDIDGVGHRDVLAASLLTLPESNAHIVALQGDDGYVMAGGRTSSANKPLLVLDLEGDCRPEILADAKALTATYPVPTPNSPSATGSWFPDRRQVVWSWEGPLALVAGEIRHVTQGFSTHSQTGTFAWAATLKTSAGQTIAREEKPFTVDQGDVRIELTPLPAAVQEGGTISLGGVVRALRWGFTGTLVIGLDDRAPLRVPVTIPLGGEQSFSVDLTSGQAGLRAITMTVLSETSTLYKAEYLLAVERPEVSVSLALPSVVGSDPVNAVGTVENTTHLTLDIEVWIERDGVAVTPRTPLTLEPRASASLPVRVETAHDAEFVLRVSGDVTASRAATVHFDATPSLSLREMGALPSGPTVIHVVATNSGSRRFEGELSWRLSGSLAGEGACPLSLEAGETSIVELATELMPGPGRVELGFGPTTAAFELNGFASAQGTIEAELPESAIEGPLTIPVRLTSVSPTPAILGVTLSLLDVTATETLASWPFWFDFAAPETVDRLLPIDVGPGLYTLRVALEGNPGHVVQSNLEVRPRQALDLVAEPGPMTTSGLLPVKIVLSNQGSEAFAGTVVALAAGVSAAVPAALAAGEVRFLEIPIDPDVLPVGEVGMVVRVVAGAENVLAERQFLVPVSAAKVAVVAASETVDVEAGGQATMQLTLANRGLQTATATIEVAVDDGNTFAGLKQVELIGGQQRAVAAVVPVPVDFPATSLPVRYAVLEQPSGPDTLRTVATGTTTIRVSPRPLRVTAQVERTHASAGEIVRLDVEVASPGFEDGQPMFVVAGYGGYSERRDIVTTSTPFRATFDVPIDEPGQDLTWAVHWPSGRAAHLDQVTIQASSGPLVLTADREEYVPGDLVTLSAQLPPGAQLEATGFGEWGSLTSLGSLLFHVPSGATRGRYPISWTLSAASDVGLINGEFVIPVRGPDVRVLGLSSDRSRVNSGETVAVRALLLSDVQVSGVVSMWLRAPSGANRIISEQAIGLSPGIVVDLSHELLLESSEPGTHEVIVVFRNGRDDQLAQASCRVDIGFGEILSVTATREIEPVTQATYVATALLQGHGDGTLKILVDGATRDESVVQMSGLVRVERALGALAPGSHHLQAIFGSAGMYSQAETDFVVEAPPSPCAVAYAMPSVISPATREFVNVAIAGVGDPVNSLARLNILGTQQDEPVMASDVEDVGPDAQLRPLRLRAERDSRGDGRVYHVRFSYESDKEACDGEVTVCVPLERGRRCVDGGALYDSTAKGH